VSLLSRPLIDDIISSVSGSAKSKAPIDVRLAAVPPLCDHTKDGRNLVVCIDGTSNQFGDKVRI